MRDVIQIAGVIDRDEAELLAGTSVEFLGLPLRLKDGREDLSEAEARTIVDALDGRVEAVCITYLDRATEIAELCDRVATPWVQLHGPIPAGEVAELRRLRPALSILKSLIVSPAGVAGTRRELDAAIDEELANFSDLVDGFLTDTFDPASGRTGATGMVHDWTVSRGIVERSPRPVILAGGLTPDNVASAIRQVRPAGVDAHTGLEGADGRKELPLVERFVREAREAFSWLLMRDT